MYTFLREMADSWALLILFLTFIGIIFWAFRPGSTEVHKELASLALRNDDLLPDDETGDK